MTESRRISYPILEVQRKIVEEKLKNVRHKLIVISGKGGVGKSFISASLALLMALKGKKVGLFDVDLHGPSIPLMLGLRGSHIYGDERGNLLPVLGPYGIKVISLEFLMTDPSKPLAWRGPLKTRAIHELLSKTKWNNLDYLIFDLPPGTGDEALTITQMIPRITGALIVTIPSVVSEAVVLKAINFCRELKIKILGIIENMAYYTCPDSNKNYPLFKTSSYKGLLAKETEVLASLPFDPRVSEAIDQGILHEIINDKSIPLVKELDRLTDIIINKTEKG